MNYYGFILNKNLFSKIFRQKPSKNQWIFHFPCIFIQNMNKNCFFCRFKPKTFSFASVMFTVKLWKVQRVDFNDLTLKNVANRPVIEFCASFLLNFAQCYHLKSLPREKIIPKTIKNHRKKRFWESVSWIGG